MKKYIVTVGRYTSEQYALETSLSKKEIFAKLLKNGYRKDQILIETLEEFWESKLSEHVKVVEQ